jgi:hypothetical protein
MVQQIQMSDQLTDEQKIEQLNATLQQITTLTIETLKYSIASIRTPQSLVTEPEFIQEFLVNCDRKFFTEIRDHIIDLRQQSEIESIRRDLFALRSQMAANPYPGSSRFFRGRLLTAPPRRYLLW